MKTNNTVILLALIVITIPLTATAALKEKAYYSLKEFGDGGGAVCPPVLKDMTGKSPDLVRHGSPEVVPGGPECRKTRSSRRKWHW